MKKTYFFHLLYGFFAVFLSGCGTPRELSEKEREKYEDDLQREMDTFDRTRHRRQEEAYKGGGYIPLPTTGTFRF